MYNLISSQHIGKKQPNANDNMLSNLGMCVVYLVGVLIVGSTTHSSKFLMEGYNLAGTYIHTYIHTNCMCACNNFFNVDACKACTTIFTSLTGCWSSITCPKGIGEWWGPYLVGKTSHFVYNKFYNYWVVSLLEELSF